MTNAYETKFMTGIPTTEKWWFWVFIVFLLWAVGPDIQLMARPVFIGPFPLLYWHELASWVVSIWLCWVAGYKLKCTQVDDIEQELLDLAEKENID